MDRKPNILFVIADDHAHWAMGCHGNREVRTPTLDENRVVALEDFGASERVLDYDTVSISDAGARRFLRLRFTRAEDPTP